MDETLKLQYKEDFLLDLANNNYSPETIYNYGRDLEVFEGYLKQKKIDFSEIDKRTISFYKGFLRSGDHLNVLEGHDKENTDITANSADNGSGGSRNDETKKSDTLLINKRSKKKEILSSRSINRMLSSLRGYLKYLIDFDLPSPISPEAVKLIKTERKESQVADLDELIKLIESPEYLEKDKAVGIRNRAILELLFSTGMRISELVSLDRDQINDAGKIYVLGKGKKARFVYLTERARAVVNKYLENRNDPYPALFIPYRGTRNSTKDPDLVRISTNYIQMKIKQYRTKLGIVVPTSAHSLRHGFATYLAEEGANPAAIQHLLGHESLQTTTRYVHGSDKFAEETHKKFHPLPNS
ncbi:tyrosine-type recombinase/integrase [Candidatus Dojkabacteria bacterium]|uniref:Tyrosine-type recombinase/integrase n=1 Tax=Candidatus Dojkabacteria bacterium TaxID=2099670 RepID=A0A955L3D7_9BACT|nr:tyrosine-type recombinase/integrase [Candidatus Dojkabacteria bacterium]